MRDLIGIPFTMHGRTKEQGFDCYGLLLELLKRQGKSLPDFVYADYEDKTLNKQINELKSLIKNKKIDNPVDNCIIAFKNFNHTAHVGFYLGNGDFIHTIKTKGVIVEKLHKWERKVEGYYNV